MLKIPALALGLQVNVYERIGSGVPSTSLLRAALQGRIDTYSHTISNRFGFESMSCAFACTLEEALDWLMNGLMCTCEVSGPDGEIVWEGFLETIEAQLGDERRSVSLREMANRVRVRYTTVLDTPGVTATSSDTTSQALYGIKDAVFTIDKSDSTEAGHFQATMLARLKNPVAAPSATVQTSSMGEVRLTLSFAGWYSALDWLLTSNTSTTKTSTTTQVGTLLTTYNSTNNFFSTSTTNITSSGITAVEFIDPDTSYRQKIESLLGRGNGTNPYAWGIYESRTFYAAAYAGASPSTITYQRNIGESVVRDSAGGVVQPWNVRPNANYVVTQLLDVAPTSTAKDSAAGFYVGRVTCSVSGDSISLALEPAETTDLTAIMITKYT